jgi:hypothetical protein
MSDYQFEFVTGCPGSHWSSITNRIRHNLCDLYDTSDLTDDRRFLIPNSFFKKTTEVDPQTLPDEKKLTHLGSYFGPSNEHGSHFDCIVNNYSVDEFMQECLSPFSNNEKTIKQIKSHWFAYNLDWIWENCKGHHLLMIWKDPVAAYSHWLDIGGWEITYPSYKWYQDLDNSMLEQIQKEAGLLLEFANKKHLQWADYNPTWLSATYNVDIDAPQYNNDMTASIKIIRTLIT